MPSPMCMQSCRESRLRSLGVETRESRPGSFPTFPRLDLSVGVLLRKARNIFEQKLAADVRNNPKSFYRYVRTKTKSKDRVGPLKDSAGNLIEDNNRMCDTLNNFFVSVFTQENTDYMFRKSTVFLMVIAVSCYVLLILHLSSYSIK